MLFILLITAYILIIPSANFGYISSSSFLRSELEDIDLRSSFLMKAFSALHLPLSSAVAAFHIFCYIMFSFSCSVKSLLFPLDFFFIPWVILKCVSLLPVWGHILLVVSNLISLSCKNMLYVTRIF